MGELVVVRRVEPDKTKSSTSMDGSWTAASRAVAGGDLAGAIVALKESGGAPVMAWRRDASARVVADRLADSIDVMIGQRLMPAPRTP